MLFAGVMSGTSCDGIDVALLDFKRGNKLIANRFEPYPEYIKLQLQAFISGQQFNIESLSNLDANLGHLYADAVNKLLLENRIFPDQVTAIGMHGQTVHHQVKSHSEDHLANTIQLGSAAITAQKTSILTVANFRQMDLTFGGQGAPLAPLLHQEMFAQPGKSVLVLNLGGIANITLINDHGITGFDTGPASCLLDEHIKSQHDLPFDDRGQWAAQGMVDQNLLQDLLSEPYFYQPFPKSTGRELFNSRWLLKSLAKHPTKPVNVQRTLAQLTVEGIVLGADQLEQSIDEVVVCGGGVHNEFLMTLLSDQFDSHVHSSDHYNINPDYIEATLMAWLAFQNVEQNVLDYRTITGTSKPLIYGVQFIP